MTVKEYYARAVSRKAKRAEKGAALGLRKPATSRKVKATLRKRLVRALDIAFSLLVRSLWKNCPFCGGGVDHCFHFVTRAKYSVRWDARNAVGSCRGCNLRYEFDPHFAISWYIAWKGLPAYEELIRDGNRTAKHSNDDLARKLVEIKGAMGAK